MRIKHLLGAAAFALASTVWAQTPAPKLIAIVSFGEHPAFTQITDGFKARMDQLGYHDGRQVTYDFMHANFDRSLVPQILQRAEAKKPALILGLTTPLNQAAVRGIKDKSIPIVFASVVDPVAAGLVPDWQHGSTWSSGASLLQNFEPSLAFVKQVVPSVKRIGTLYNPGEDNDKTNMDLYQKAARKLGLEVVAVPVDNANDIRSAHRVLRGRWTRSIKSSPTSSRRRFRFWPRSPDASGYPCSIRFTPKTQGSTGGLSRRFLSENGEHAADIADRILKGEKPADIAPYVPKPADFDSYISPQGLQAVGLSVPPELANSPWIIK
jgi:putative ABC transport system substrate-binding protein